jgi:hypothetical protein
MTDPDQIARGIVRKISPIELNEWEVKVLVPAIATALREYGEAEYLKGRKEQNDIQLDVVIKQADAEGYRRGHSCTHEHFVCECPFVKEEYGERCNQEGGK